MLTGLWIDPATGQANSFLNLLPDKASNFTGLSLLSHVGFLSTVMMPFRVFPDKVWTVGLSGLFEVWFTSVQ